MSEASPSTEAVQSRVTVADTQYVEQRVSPPSHLHLGNLTVTIGGAGMPGNTTMDSASAIPVGVERQFRELAQTWYLETMPLSSYIEKILHPSYQKILVLGKRAVPLIMDEISDMPNDWFWALRMLADVDPVRAEDAGNMQAMANAWLEWWKTDGPTWLQQNGL